MLKMHPDMTPLFNELNTTLLISHAINIHIDLGLILFYVLKRAFFVLQVFTGGKNYP